jgi:periplasmic divalent cation tolerance protein
MLQQDGETMPQVVSVATTVGTADEARLLARRVIDERLAACVQIDHGVTSLYRWEGKLCEHPEVRLLVKTIPQAVPALQALFDREHPYQLPQFLVTVVEASAAYADWVRSEVSVAPASQAGTS